MMDLGRGSRWWMYAALPALLLLTAGSAGAKDIGAAKAKKIALAKTGGGTAVKCQIDYENGVRVYEVEIVKSGYEYSMDVVAATGQVRDFEKEWRNPGAAAPRPKLAAAQAKAIARRRVGGGAVTWCRLTWENGVRVYEIDIILGNYAYSMDVSANTGKIRDFEKERRNKAAVAKQPIGEAKAKAIALREVGGGKVVECELDRDDGRLVYEIEVIHSYREFNLEIDAYTGKVIEFEIDD